eukprot:8610531-Pyramimonas_sp.AAC.1
MATQWRRGSTPRHVALDRGPSAMAAERQQRLLANLNPDGLAARMQAQAPSARVAPRPDCRLVARPHCFFCLESSRAESHRGPLAPWTDLARAEP